MDHYYNFLPRAKILPCNSVSEELKVKEYNSKVTPLHSGLSAIEWNEEIM
jgi:hypothetical protein